MQSYINFWLWNQANNSFNMGEQLHKILHQIKSWPHFISYTGNKDQLPGKCAQGVHLAMDFTECYTLYPEQSG